MTRLIKTLENLQRMMLTYRIQMERLTVKDYPRITHGAAPNGKQVTNKANTNQLQHPKSRGSCSRTGTIQKPDLVLIEPSNVHSTHTFTNLITGGDHSEPSCFCGPPRVACIHLFTALLGLNSFCKNVFIRLFSIFKNTEFDKFFFLNAIKLRKARAVSSVVHAALARVRSLRRRLSLCPRSL